MVILIATITIILYIILIAFTAKSLGDTIELRTKVIYIIIGLIVMTIITSIVFFISTKEIKYENVNLANSVRNILITVFVPVNGIITMPYLARLLSKINSNEITQLKLKKTVTILAILFIVLLVFECSYLKNTQIGILNIINN